jgi:hypothetical protein
MLSTAMEQERLLIAQRLLSEIERRHGLPHPAQRELHPVIMDRFLAVYLPEAREGEPVPQALEYAFAPRLTDALDLLRDVVTESDDGCGAALYVHDLDTGVTADSREPHWSFPSPRQAPASASRSWPCSPCRLPRWPARRAHRRRRFPISRRAWPQ